MRPRRSFKGAFSELLPILLYGADLSLAASHLYLSRYKYDFGKKQGFNTQPGDLRLSRHLNWWNSAPLHEPQCSYGARLRVVSRCDRKLNGRSLVPSSVQAAVDETNTLTMSLDSSLCIKAFHDQNLVTSLMLQIVPACMRTIQR